MQIEMSLNCYNFFAGTTRGVLIYNLGGTISDIKHVKPDEPSEITHLSQGRKSEEILVGFRNGSMGIFDVSDAKYRKQVRKIEGDGPVVSTGVANGKYIIARQDGIVNIWSGKKKNDFLNLNLSEDGTLEIATVNKYREGILATGGEKNDLKLFDIEQKEIIFKAKSMGHDYLNLPIPTSIRDITFLPNDADLTTCCTKEGHVLLYDQRIQRRPVVKFLEKQASYTVIAVGNIDKQILVGTTRGYVQLIDLKSPGKCLRTFKSFTGCVTGIYCDPLEPTIVTTSLDRYLRVFDLNSKEVKGRFYLKQSLTRLLASVAVKEEKDEEENEMDKIGKDVEDEEYEKIFCDMETVGDIKKKRRKSEDDVERRKSKIKKKV